MYVGILSLDRAFAAKFPLVQRILRTQETIQDKCLWGKIENRRASCCQIKMKYKSLGIFFSVFQAVSCAAVQKTCGDEVVLQEVIGVA